MKQKIFFLVLSGMIFLSFNPVRAGDETDTPADTPYPEKKYYEMDYSVMNKTRVGLENLYMKTPAPDDEVDLGKIDRTFFKEGTVRYKQKDYLKEAEKNRWEEWSPVFYEFGKMLKKKGKRMYHEWFFPDQKRK